jgi:hypothetical protein
MSAYNGRRGQDTMAFIRGLNMIDPSDEFLNLDGEDNLDIFRNTTFTDESGVAIDFQAFPQKPDAAPSSTSTAPMAVSTATATATTTTTSPLDNISPYLGMCFHLTSYHCVLLFCFLFSSFSFFSFILFQEPGRLACLSHTSIMFFSRSCTPAIRHSPIMLRQRKNSWS